MARHSLRKLSAGGDTTIAEWDTDTITEERLNQIQAEYDKLIYRAGSTAFDITHQGEGTMIARGTKLDPNADTLVIPPVAGGSE